MDSSILLILASLAIATIIIVFFTSRRSASSDPSLVEWLKSMDKRLDDTTRGMLSSQRAIYDKLVDSAKTIGELSEVSKSIKDLETFLISPKLRGGLGEQVLKVLLSESLPQETYSLQYAFKSGVRVDAAIKTASGIIPIDSKFSLENFKRMISAESEKDREIFKKSFVTDVKDRIDEISKKYILSDEGTVDFALMYIPSESVYYEIVSGESALMDYAYKRRVMPVSPSTFYAFLRSILLSFEGQKIAVEIKNIQSALRSINLETGKLAEFLSTLQTHINNSYAAMTKVASQFAGLSNKIESVERLGSGSKELKSKLD